MSEIDRSQFHPLHLDSADRFVYRYRTAKRALKEIEKKKVRMSPFPELNDPKEFADWDFDLHASQEFPNPNWQKPQEEASAYAKNCAKVLCATLDDKSALDRTNIDSIWAVGFLVHACGNSMRKIIAVPAWFLIARHLMPQFVRRSRRDQS